MGKRFLEEELSKGKDYVVINVDSRSYGNEDGTFTTVLFALIELNGQMFSGKSYENTKDAIKEALESDYTIWGKAKTI